MQYIAFDSHKHYTQARVENTAGNLIREAGIMHERGTMREFLTQYEPGSSVAVETVGNWYWIVDEIEAAGCVPKLVYAHKAKLMMGMINKRISSMPKGSIACSGPAPCQKAGFPEVRCGINLSVVIAAEVGDGRRFEGPDYLASYAGTTPRVHASGGKTRYCPLHPDVNRYV